MGVHSHLGAWGVFVTLQSGWVRVVGGMFKNIVLKNAYFETIKRHIANFKISYLNMKLVLLFFGEEGIFIPSILLPK